MKRTVTIWLADTDTHIPVDLIPGAIAEAIYPLPDREGEIRDPDAVERLKKERAHAAELRKRFHIRSENHGVSPAEVRQYLAEHDMELELRRLSEPPTDQAEVTPPAEHRANGVIKREILAVAWPLPQGAPTLQNILDELPKWVADACTKVGRPGKGPNGSHLWNPAILAVCLATKTPQKQWAVGKGELTAHLRRYYPEYLDQWEDAVKRL